MVNMTIICSCFFVELLPYESLGLPSDFWSQTQMLEGIGECSYSQYWSDV
jgi:hypothetical protein